MALVTGALSDVGIEAFPDLKPLLKFTPSGPATAGTRLFATKPVTVPVNAGSGIFSVDLQPTTSMRPAVWYVVTIEWLDPAGNYVSNDFLQWKLFVPSGGGNFGDLIGAPANPMLFWVSDTAPVSPQKGQRWLNTTTSKITEWNGTMFVEVSDIKGAKGDQGERNPEQDARLGMIETLLAEPGYRVRNMVIDPIPATASADTYTAGRATIEQREGWGRTVCTDVGATSLYPDAATIAGATSRFPAVAGDRVATRVEIKGHPTQDMGATLTFNGYRWDGAAFVAADTAMGISSGQFKVAAGTTQVFEALGTVPASNTTHVLPMLTWRRWAETYPQVGDYVEWRHWATDTGLSAATSSPVPYTDGTQPSAYWTGAQNASPSIALTARTDPNAAAMTREMLVSSFKARRGGAIGTNKATVALRFDHHLTPFVADIYPELVSRGLPWAQVQNPETIGTAGNNGWTYAQLQTAAINTGGEVWNHGGNHLDASGAEALRAQILGSLTALKAGLPKLAIEGWAPPGIAAPAYDGYSPMQTVEQHTETFAGRLILANHATVSGYMGGVYRPLNGELSIGQAHYTMDEQTAATVDGVIRGAISARAGLVLMLHPNYLGTAGFMSKEDFIAVLDNLVARRDAGEIEIVTLSGLSIAHAASQERHDLVVNGRFTNGLNNWANTAGWTLNTVNGLTYATTTTGTPITQAVSFTRSADLRGGAREIVYKVRSTTGAVVRTAATGTGVVATKDHTLPASPGWREVRQPLVVPLDFTGSLTLAAGRASGGEVNISDIRLQAI